MNTPKILLTAEDYELLRALHRKSEADRVEYMFMGGAVRVPEGFLIRTLVFPQQAVDASYVEADGPPLWLKDIAGSHPVWIHTHLCQAFWSGTDENTINSLVPAKKDDNKLRLTVAIVLGRDKFRGRIDIHSPIEITLDDLSVEVLADPNAEEVADEQVRGMCHGKIKPYIIPLYGGRGRNRGPIYSPDGLNEEDEWSKIRKRRGYLV